MPNYPDLLGTLTQGQRLTLDVAELAFGLRPKEIAAGRIFEAILLVQNTVDCDVDAKIRLIVPDKDLKGARSRFVTKADKWIVVGLRPGEVGYVSLPTLANPQTAPGSGYEMQIGVEITRQDKNPGRVREGGGSSVDYNQVTAEARAELQTLQPLSFSTATHGKPSKNAATLSAPFTLSAPQISKLEQPAKAGWKSLWTMHQSLGTEDLATQARPYTAVVLPQLTRRNLFFPMLKAIQQHAEDAGYRLWAGEAVVLAKMVVVLLETGQPAPGTDVETVQYPRWFERMCQLLIQQPDLTGQVEQLMTEMLFDELIYDSALNAFAMLKSATTEDLGSPAEMKEYAEALSKSFMGEGDPLDYAHIYLPLGLAGIYNNGRLLMPGEAALDSLELMVNARIQRDAERDDGNEFIFDLGDQLIDRALHLVDKTLTLQRYLDPIERLKKL